MPRPSRSAGKGNPSRILVVDIGGTHLKVMASGETQPRKRPSGPELTPSKMVTAVKRLAKGWKYDAVSIGFPGPAGRAGPLSEPGNLGKGWVGFDFAAAFDAPVKVANDAAMQALGSYDGGRMLFVGLGTGLGGALIADRAIVPMELSELPWRRTRETLGDVLSARGLERSGIRQWRKVVDAVGARLMKVFLADYVVLGGGNANRLKELPQGLRLGHNLTAFRGGFRLWHLPEVPLTSTETPIESRDSGEWRVL
jgi:polyphosphate glucokinase